MNRKPLYGAGPGEDLCRDDCRRVRVCTHCISSGKVTKAPAIVNRT
jgi:hypothetical protein